MDVLIVANPGLLRDGLMTALVSLLDAAPRSVKPEMRAVFEALRTASPALVIIDAESARPAHLQCVRAIKRWAPHVPLLALVDRSAHTQAVLGAGADQVMLKGFAVSALTDAVRRLCLSTPTRI